MLIQVVVVRKETDVAKLLGPHERPALLVDHVVALVEDGILRVLEIPTIGLARKNVCRRHIMLVETILFVLIRAACEHWSRRRPGTQRLLNGRHVRDPVSILIQ